MCKKLIHSHVPPNVWLLFCLIFGLCLLRCNLCIAQDAILQPFDLTGALRVGKPCQDPSQDNQLYPITFVSLSLIDTNIEGQNISAIAAVDLDDTDTPQINDGRYDVVLQRDVDGTLINYRYYSLYIVVENNRRIYPPRPEPFTAPPEGTDTINIDLGVEPACSILLTFRSLGPGDRIRRFYAWAIGEDEGGNLVGCFNNSSKVSDVVDANTDQHVITTELLVPPGYEYEVYVDRVFFVGLSTPVSKSSSVWIAADQCDQCDGNGVNVNTYLEIQKPPSGYLELDLFLRPDDADVLANVGPRATTYNMVTYGEDLEGNGTGYTGVGLAYSDGLAPVSTRPGAIVLGWYKFTSFSAHPKIRLTWLDDRQPPGPYYAYYNSSNPGPGLWSPLHTAETPGEPLTPGSGMDPDGTIVLTEHDLDDETGEFVERLIFDNYMAYISGTLQLAGCLNTSDIEKGAAEMFAVREEPRTTFVNELGMTRSTGSWDYPGPGNSRGLFANDGSGSYEVVVTAGPWWEWAYRLQFSGPNGESEILSILPDDRRIFDMQPGRAQEYTDNDRTYLTSRVTIMVTVENDPAAVADGAPLLRPFRKPEVLITKRDTGHDAYAFPFSLSNSYTGRFWNRIFGPDELKPRHFVRIHGISNSEVELLVRAHVPVNPDGTGQTSYTTFPRIFNVPFLSGQADCEEACIDISGAIYIDDGNPPVVTLDSELPEITSEESIVVAGIATDQVPIVSLLINGVEMVDNSPTLEQPFALDVPLLLGINPIDIEATDLCGHTTIINKSIERLEFIEINIDIKPQSCPNPLNVSRKGVLSVAILGSEDLDVTTIDVNSVRLAGVAPIRSSYEDVATPLSDKDDECECTTEGPDGYIDLTLKFETQEIVNTIGEVVDGEILALTLTANLLDGKAIEGKDCIVVLSKEESEE